jgi:regulator of sigma D
MLDNCNNNQERWDAVEELLQRWLRERREILVKYGGIAATMDKLDEPAHLYAGVHRLRQVLVDYISAGHFEVFHELIREAEAFADDSGHLASDIIASIADTTEVIMGFDEKYGAAEPGSSELNPDLSLLGEMLELRFSLEDQLIARLHKVHASN